MVCISVLSQEQPWVSSSTFLLLALLSPHPRSQGFPSCPWNSLWLCCCSSQGSWCAPCSEPCSRSSWGGLGGLGWIRGSEGKLGGLGVNWEGWGCQGECPHQGAPGCLLAAPQGWEQAQLQSQLCRLSISSCPRSCIKYSRIFSQDSLALGRGIGDWILDGSKCERGLGQLGKEFK